MYTLIYTSNTNGINRKHFILKKNNRNSTRLFTSTQKPLWRLGYVTHIHNKLYIQYEAVNISIRVSVKKPYTKPHIKTANSFPAWCRSLGGRVAATERSPCEHNHKSTFTQIPRPYLNRTHFSSSHLQISVIANTSATEPNSSTTMGHTFAASSSSSGSRSRS